MNTSLVSPTGRAAGVKSSAGGTAMLVAGLSGAVAGVAVASWPDQVAPDQASYPLGRSAHIAFQVFFALQHLGLLLGVVTLISIAGMARPTTRLGLWLASLGLTGYALLDAVVAFAGFGIRDDSARWGTFVAVYVLVSLAMGLGLTIAGAGLARRPVLVGRGRWLPLALGVWVFVPMMPALAASFPAGQIAIIGWMLLFADLGLHLRRTSSGLRP